MNQYRRLPFVGLVTIILAYASAIILQYYANLEPCPLCVLQRLAYIIIAVVFLIATIHAPKNCMKTIYGALAALGCLAGGAVAARQIWLQHLPKDLVPSCGPGIDMLLENFPLTEVLQIILKGSGDCANVKWSFLGLSMASYSLLCFIFLFILSLYYARK